MAFYIYDMLNILLEEKFAMAHDQYRIIPEQLFQVFPEQAGFVIWSCVLSARLCSCCHNSMIYRNLTLNSINRSKITLCTATGEGS